MIWAVHGKTVKDRHRRMVDREDIAQYELPLVMKEILDDYQAEHVFDPELRSLTSLRFTGMVGDQLLARQQRLVTERDNYVADVHARQERPPPKAMPQIMTTSIRSPNVPSTTIIAKQMPASSSASMPATRPGHDGRDLGRRSDGGAPAAKAARHGDSTWSAGPASSWGSQSWKGSGKRKGKMNIIDVETNTSAWHTSWSAWEANTRDRQGKGWSWNPSGGQ